MAMKFKSVIVSVALALTIVIFYTSCRKNDRENDKDTTAAIDNASAENVFAGVLKSIGEFTDSTSQLRSGGCAYFRVDSVGTTSWPKTLTIDFGSTNCLCADGNYRKGKIIAIFSGRYRDSLTVINISLVNYYHNNNLVQVGTHTITNNGHNPAGHLTYTINVQNARITTPNGVVSWNSVRTREWIAGESTMLDPTDDVYLITGSANGTGVSGNSFNVIINTPLRVALNCRYIESGSLTLTPVNLLPRVVDFGDGTCDDQATMTVNGKTYNITM